MGPAGRGLAVQERHHRERASPEGDAGRHAAGRPVFERETGLGARHGQLGFPSVRVIGRDSPTLLAMTITCTVRDGIPDAVTRRAGWNGTSTGSHGTSRDLAQGCGITTFLWR